MWGSVRSGTAHRKQNAISCLTSQKEDAYEIWWAPIKNTTIHRQNFFFSFLTLYVELHFRTRWSTWRSCSCSKHESFCTNLRKHVVLNILIELLTVLLLLQPHIYISSCSSLHSSSARRIHSNMVKNQPKWTLSACGCRKFQIDPLGDHLCTRTTHSFPLVLDLRLDQERFVSTSDLNLKWTLALTSWYR